MCFFKKDFLITTLPIPATPKRTVTDEYHGIPVADNYRWLEDAASPAVQTWMTAQNDLARSLMDASPAPPAMARWCRSTSSAANTPTHPGWQSKAAATAAC